MLFQTIVQSTADSLLFGSCLFILAGSILISFKLRFIQLRLLPELFRMIKSHLFRKDHAVSEHTLPPFKALLTAMSTTLGLSTIVAPVIAIQLGGPGALLGFLLTSFFGSAATFVEVNLGLQHRKEGSSGEVIGGPMPYLKEILSSLSAKWYAVLCLILMTAWSATQANQIAAVFDSPLLGEYRVPTYVTGAVIAAVSLFVLLGGIKRVGSISAKLVPIMFFLYVGASLSIIALNIDQLPGIFMQMFHSVLSPQEVATGGIVGGIVSAMRWGIFKGTQACEAGIGTQAIVHSLAETKDPRSQATLAMFSTYAAGMIAFITGCVALITNTWQDPELTLGIGMVVESFRLYFSYFGVAIVVVSVILFGFGTVLGNSFNGSQCFKYLTKNRGVKWYLVSVALMTFIGAITEVKTLWSSVDIILAAMVLPHMAALLVHVFKKAPLLVKN